MILEKAIEYKNSPRDNFVKDVLEAIESESDESN